MKTHLGASTSQKNLEEKSKRHPNMKDHLMSKSQFGTFGVPNGTLKGQNFPDLGFGPTAFGWRLCIPFSIFSQKDASRFKALIIRTYFF